MTASSSGEDFSKIRPTYQEKILIITYCPHKIVCSLLQLHIGHPWGIQVKRLLRHKCYNLQIKAKQGHVRNNKNHQQALVICTSLVPSVRVVWHHVCADLRCRWYLEIKELRTFCFLFIPWHLGLLLKYSTIWYLLTVKLVVWQWLILTRVGASQPPDERDKMQNCLLCAPDPGLAWHTVDI